MANRVKEVSAFNGTSWGAAVPLGANDANIDITSSTSQPDGSAVSGVTGDSATALDTAAVAVASGDTGASAWTKFNRFRKRVASNFANYIQGSIATSYNATGSDSAVYSTNVLNNYMANVIGYSGTTAPEAGSVADQLSSLNDNQIAMSTMETFTLTKGSGTSNWTLNNYVAYRIGNICFLELTLTVTSAEGSDTVTITTLPARMKPPIQFQLRAVGGDTGTDFNFRINTNCTVTVGRLPTKTNGTCRMQVTYPVLVE